MDGEEGQVFMVVEKSGAQLPALSPIGRPLNPGGQTAQLGLLNEIIFILFYLEIKFNTL
jgi:hypothetical protein